MGTGRALFSNVPYLSAKMRVELHHRRWQEGRNQGEHDQDQEHNEFDQNEWHDAHVVQLLGAFAGSPVLPPDLAGFGCTVIAIKPEVMMPEADFRSAVAEYANAVRNARPVKGGPPVRMPFDRSAAQRRETLAAGTIDVSDVVHGRLKKFVA